MAELTREDKEQLQQGLMREALKFKRRWQEEVPVYRGQYRASISIKKTDNWGVIVGTNLEKAKALEYGLGQGSWPNTDHLRKWVDRVINPPEDELDSVTFLVARKIWQEGVNENASMHRAIQKYKSRK